jgi:hypothetical protein
VYSPRDTAHRAKAPANLIGIITFTKHAEMVYPCAARLEETCKGFNPPLEGRLLPPARCPAERPRDSGLLPKWLSKQSRSPISSFSGVVKIAVGKARGFPQAARMKHRPTSATARLSSPNQKLPSVILAQLGACVRYRTFLTCVMGPLPPRFSFLRGKLHERRLRPLLTFVADGLSKPRLKPANQSP